jgi:hypothetical protein
LNINNRIYPRGGSIDANPCGPNDEARLRKRDDSAIAREERKRLASMRARLMAWIYSKNLKSRIKDGAVERSLKS